MSRLRIPQRTRIYLGCEGQSEQSYAARLGQIADAAGLHIHIDNDVLRPGGGDPLALVQLAIRRIEEKELKRGTFAHRAVLLDRDRLGQVPERDRQVRSLISRTGLRLLWQDSCHESFLLRHFAGHTRARPAAGERAIEALKRIWPDYYKGMPATQLATRIDIAAIRRVCAVEAQFADFLADIGLLQS